MKYQLTRLGVWSAVKITFVVAGVVGFVVGGLYALLITAMASLIGIAGMDETMPDEIGMIVGATGFVAVVIWIMFTAVYAVVGALVVGLTSWLYNLMAGAIGGVTLTLEAEPAAVPVASTGAAPATPAATDAPPATADSAGPDPQST